MTQQEINTLKAKFQAGAYPTQQAFEALIDAIANGSSSSNGGALVITADILLRNQVLRRKQQTSSEYTLENPYTYTKVSELLDAYATMNNTSVNDVTQVIVVNTMWDADATGSDDAGTAMEGSWENIVKIDAYTSYTTAYDAGNHDSVGNAYPMYIKTDYTTSLPNVGSSAIELNNGWLEVSDSEIEALPRGHAMMFVKRTYVDSSTLNNVTTWVPVNRNITLTEYELGQMAQDYAASANGYNG